MVLEHEVLRYFDVDERRSRVNDHPTATELDGFAWNRTPTARTRAIVTHLMRGCASCRAAVAPHFAALLGLAPPPELTLSAQEDAEYDAVIDRVFTNVLVRARELRDGRPPAPLAASADAGVEALPEVSRPPEVPQFEALLKQSWALRNENPAEMMRLAEEARDLAESLGSTLGAAAAADLRCRAWIELGNAHRVTDNFSAAERALGRATEFYLEGSQDEILAARLFSIQASTLGDCRRFDLAETALDLVFTIHRRRGDDHEAGRALLKKGIYAGYRGNTDQALQLMDQGLSLLDEDREPALVYTALHNKARFLLDSGQLREARMALWKAKARGLDSGGQVFRLRTRWLEGQINAALGESDRAEAAFREVQAGFQEVRLIYKAALVGLELGALLLRQTRTEAAAREILASADTFMALGIGREASASVLLLRGAAEQRIVDAGLIEYVADQLRLSEGAEVTREAQAE
jgi:tetratricopeptide (TPR) repeat protein